MAARKQSANSTPGEVVTMMPRLPKHLMALMEPTEKVTTAQRQASMSALFGLASRRALTALEIRRYGRGVGVRNICPFCGIDGGVPPKDEHQTGRRKTWFIAHLLDHVLKGDAPDKLGIIHGDVSRV